MPGNVKIEIPDEFTLKIADGKLVLPEFQIGQIDPKKTVRKPELAFEVDGDPQELSELIRSEYQRVAEPFKAAQLATFIPFRPRSIALPNALSPNAALSLTIRVKHQAPEPVEDLKSCRLVIDPDYRPARADLARPALDDARRGPAVTQASGDHDRRPHRLPAEAGQADSQAALARPGSPRVAASPRISRCRPRSRSQSSSRPRTLPSTSVAIRGELSRGESHRSRARGAGKTAQGCWSGRLDQRVQPAHPRQGPRRSRRGVPAGHRAPTGVVQGTARDRLRYGEHDHHRLQRLGHSSASALRGPAWSGCAKSSAPGSWPTPPARCPESPMGSG